MLVNMKQMLEDAEKGGVYLPKLLTEIKDLLKEKQ
jgi:hypothetical protein